MLEQALNSGAQASGIVPSPISPIPLASAGIPSQGTTDAPVGESHGLEEGGVTEAAFNTALQKLIAAAGGKASITSGKRSEKRQEELWAQALEKYGDPEIADNWVARPRSAGGKGSNHTRGIAADLKYADAATKKWIHENAAKYGLHFPLSNEPWHIELRGSRG